MENENRNSRRGIRITKTVVAVILVLFVAVNCFTVVPTGYTGVRTTFGQISEKTVPNGINFKIPFIQSITLVNNKQQDITDETRVWSETSERTAIYYEGITVSYRVSPDASSWIFANVTNYDDALVTSQLVASAVKSSSKTLTDTEATSRVLVEGLVQQNLQAGVDQKYREGAIVINKVTISNIDFEDSYNEAIASRQRAQIEAEQQAIENEKAIAKAEAEATVKKTNAQAEADALLIQAEAEAEANRTLQKSLTEEVLRQKYLEKWDGALPKVSTNSCGLIFDYADDMTSGE